MSRASTKVEIPTRFAVFFSGIPVYSRFFLRAYCLRTLTRVAFASGQVYFGRSMDNFGQLVVFGVTHMVETISQQLATAGYDVVRGIAPELSPDALVLAVEDMADAAPYLSALSELDSAPCFVFANTAEADAILAALHCGASNCFLAPVTNLKAFEQVFRREVSKRRRLSDLQRQNTQLQNMASLLQRDQQAGHQVQMSMLPQSPVRILGFDFSHQLIPSLYLSGDFIDYFPVGTDHIVFFIADVSGHGSASGFCTVLLKKLFARKRAHYSERGDHTIISPARILSLVNDELLGTKTGKYATMVVGVMDLRRRELCYGIAGHLPLPMLFSDGQAQYLQGEGAPVGLMASVSHQEYRIELPAAFSLALFSDGILEVLKQENLVEKESALLQDFARMCGRGDALLENLKVGEGMGAPDDIAALFLGCEH